MTRRSPEGAFGADDTVPRRDLRTYQREWFAARRAAWFAANGPCVRCGSWEQLELDHIDPAEKVHHRVWSWSAERRAAELAKCQVLCESCHQEKTSGEWRGRWEQSAEPHRGLAARGTTGAYRRGCRCVDCCRAQSEYKAGYRARQQGQTPASTGAAWGAQALRRRGVPHADPIASADPSQEIATTQGLCTSGPVSTGAPGRNRTCDLEIRSETGQS